MTIATAPRLPQKDNSTRKTSHPLGKEISSAALHLGPRGVGRVEWNGANIKAEIRRIRSFLRA